MEKVVITVIVAFYNSKLFMTETIGSVLTQTYTLWQLILVDDGSTDGSSELAKKYVKDYPGKIIYIEHKGHENKGLSASRNLGLKHAEGNVISFLDADDVWLPEYLEMQIKLLEDKKVSMVCEATLYWHDWNDIHKKNDKVSVGTKENEIYDPPQLAINLYPLGVGAAPCMCGIIVRKEVLLKHGGFEEAFSSMYEDQVFLSKIYLHEPVFISSNCNNLYRQRSDSMMNISHQKGEYYSIRKKFLLWYKDFYLKSSVNNEQIHQLIRKAWKLYQVSLFVKFKSLIKRILSKFT